jgi:hypothetical protein
MCFLLLLFLPFHPTNNDKLATDFAKQFYSAYESSNCDTLESLTITPFYQDGQAIIRTQAELKSAIQKLISERGNAPQRIADVKLVASYAAMKERMQPKDREMLDQIVKDDDLLVLVMLKPSDPASKKVDNVVLLVRLIDGKPKAIGIKHTF